MKNRFFSIAILLVVMISGGCTKYKRTYSKPLPANLFSFIKKSKISSLRSRGKVDAMMAKGRLKVKVFMIADSMGRLRFDAITPPPLNSTVLLLTSDGSTFRALDKRSNKYYQGNSGACSIKAIMGIPLSSTELFALLIGEPVGNGTITSHKWDGDTGSEVISQKNGNKKSKVWVFGRNGKKGWRIVKQLIDTPKGKVKVEYRGYKKVDKKWIPYRIRISTPGKKGDTIFVWNKIELNPEVEVEAFNQNPPPGVTIKRLICGD
jgi:outer membrane lipoprotein-sorting protein